MKDISKVVRSIKKQVRTKIRFWLYRISDGLKELIKVFSDDFIKRMYPKPEKRRRDLFTVSGVRF